MGGREILSIVGRGLEEAMSSCSSRVHDPLRHSIAVKSGQSINQMNILKEERSLFARSLCTQWLEILLSIASGVREIGIVEVGHLLFQEGPLEKVGLVSLLIATGDGGSVQCAS